MTTAMGDGGLRAEVLDTVWSAPGRMGFEVESLVIPTLAEIARYWPPDARFDPP